MGNISVVVSGGAEAKIIRGLLKGLALGTVKNAERTLIILSGNERRAQKKALSLSARDMLLLNADLDFPGLGSDIAAPTITFGLNPKACVTASSIGTTEAEGGSVVCCVQRTLPVFTGQDIEPGEFAVPVSGRPDACLLLAYALAALVCGVSQRTLSERLIKF